MKLELIIDGKIYQINKMGNAWFVTTYGNGKWYESAEEALIEFIRRIKDKPVEAKVG